MKTRAEQLPDGIFGENDEKRLVICRLSEPKESVSAEEAKKCEYRLPEINYPRVINFVFCLIPCPGFVRSQSAA